ncbi:MAG: NusG domain II-containing protein [Nevskiales bacterium]|nr:NusG domain II-containing protein [Nevskiales bacterium]
MTRGDALALAVAAAIVGALYAHLWQPSVAASRFDVSVGGKPVGHYSMMVDRTLQIQGRMGVSTLKVENGRVRFLDSPCRNKICVHSGWLGHSGDAAACLPNRVSISLSGDAGSGLDAVSF